jgi:hypothetical protein
MNEPSPKRSKLRYYLVGVLAVAVVLLGVGLGAPSARGAAERSRAALEAGVSIQEGLLAIAPEDRRFSLVVVAQPESLGRTSTLRFDGEAVVVAARNRLSKSGRVTLHEALAQLSGELASVDEGLKGWRVELDFGDEVRAEVLLSPEGKILP